MLLDVNEVVDVVFVLLRMGLLGVDGDKRGQVGESRSKLKKNRQLKAGVTTLKTLTWT